MIVKTEKGRVFRKFLNANTGVVADSLKEVYAGEPLSKEGLSWYFTIGYVPGDMTLFENIYCLPGGATCEIIKGGYKVLERFYYEDLIDKAKYADISEEKLLTQTHQTLLTVVEEGYRQDKNIVLALTGGLDSRLLLGALLEVTEAKNIFAFSWGFKNSYDYEIGKILGKKVGLKHYSYDLNSIPFGVNELQRFAELSDCNTNLFEQPPVQLIQRDFSSHTQWYGMLGGTASGSNLPDSWLETPESFYLLNERKRTGRLSDVAYSVMGESIGVEDVKNLLKDYKVISHDMIDIYNHHERLIAHTVFFKGNKYCIPFASDEWLGLTLSLPSSFRNRKRYLLIEIIRKFYSELAKVPSANNKGLPLTAQKGEMFFLKLKDRLRVKNTGLRKKFLELSNLSKSKDWSYLLDDYLLKKDIGFEKLNKAAECLLNESNRIDHFKTIELLFSISIIKNLNSKC